MDTRIKETVKGHDLLKLIGNTPVVDIFKANHLAYISLVASIMMHGIISKIYLRTTQKVMSTMLPDICVSPEMYLPGSAR